MIFGFWGIFSCGIVGVLGTFWVLRVCPCYCGSLGGLGLFGLVWVCGFVCAVCVFGLDVFVWGGRFRICLFGVLCFGFCLIGGFG